MAKISVSIPDDLRTSLERLGENINLSKVVTDALDDYLKKVEDGCFWGQEYGVMAKQKRVVDLEDIGENLLSADRLKSSSDPADVVFARRVWLGLKPTAEAKRFANGFIKWLEENGLRQKSKDAHWMGAFGLGVRLVYEAEKSKD